MATTVPLDDAARRLGIHPATLRRRLKRGELRGTREPTGQGFRWLIELDDDAPAAAPTREGPDAYALRTLALERDALAQEVRRLSAHVDDVRAQLESRTREAAELHRLLAQAHQLALPTPASGEERKRVWASPVFGGPDDQTQNAPQGRWPAGRPWWQKLLWG